VALKFPADLQTWIGVANRRGARPLICLAAYVLLSAAAADAHEFWLEPIDYRPAVGDSVPIVQRAGLDFAGLSYPYLREDTRRFSLFAPEGEQPIQAIEGDDPAAEVAFAKPGLTTIVYHGAANELVFETMAKFEESLRYEHLDPIIDAHVRSGKPNTNIKEQYSRCAKALVAVGSGEGEDRPIGLPLELIAERNPYQLKPGEPLPVRLLHEGKPLGGVTIKIFSHDDPQSPRQQVTDAEGRIAVALPKHGEYLIHAVHMRAPREREAADWVSLWASLTFLRP